MKFTYSDRWNQALSLKLEKFEMCVEILILLEIIKSTLLLLFFNKITNGVETLHFV